MQYICLVFVILTLSSCNQNSPEEKEKQLPMQVDQMNLKNETVRNYQFLAGMYDDDYYPDFLVDKCKQILLDLCDGIEKEKPANLDELYRLTHASTKRINELENEFDANDSELETIARELLAEDFLKIATAYGFEDADIEELIATRNW